MTNLGRQNALEALDQAALFRDRDDAIESYYENLQQTLADMGARIDCWEAANEGFISVLTERGITCRGVTGY